MFEKYVILAVVFCVLAEISKNKNKIRFWWLGRRFQKKCLICVLCWLGPAVLNKNMASVL